jgi:hypothetical protein
MKLLIMKFSPMFTIFTVVKLCIAILCVLLVGTLQIVTQCVKRNSVNYLLHKCDILSILDVQYY